jgi:hypothetical protein
VTHSNGVLRRIFELKRDELTGGCQKLIVQNEELYNLYSSPNKIKMMKSRMDRACRTNDKKVFVKKRSRRKETSWKI